MAANFVPSGVEAKYVDVPALVLAPCSNSMSHVAIRSVIEFVEEKDSSHVISSLELDPATQE